MVDRNLFENCNSITNDGGCFCAVRPGTANVILSNNVAHDCQGNSDSSPPSEAGLTVSWYENFLWIFLNFCVSLHIPPETENVTGVNNTLFRCSFASFKIYRSHGNIGQNNCLFGSTFQTAIIAGKPLDNTTYNNLLIGNTAVSATSGQR